MHIRWRGGRRHTKSHDRRKPLRIGFVSADFRRHPVGFFVAPVMASRPREGFEFVCYSDVAAPDALTAQLAADADLWRSVDVLDDEALAALIRQDKIDILVDLAGHTRGNRLLTFARKPAPIQVDLGRVSRYYRHACHGLPDFRPLANSSGGGTMVGGEVSFHAGRLCVLRCAGSMPRPCQDCLPRGAGTSPLAV